MAGDLRSGKVLEFRFKGKKCLLIEEGGKVFKVCGDYDPFLEGAVDIVVRSRYGKAEWNRIGEHVQVMDV